MTYLIDGLQYSNWSEEIFRQLRKGGVDAVHVTLTYHENFRETVTRLEAWNRWFETYPELIFQGFTADDLARARATGRTAIFFGAQNPSCIEDDIGLVEILYRLGFFSWRLLWHFFPEEADHKFYFEGFSRNQSTIEGICFSNPPGIKKFKTAHIFVVLFSKS